MSRRYHAAVNTAFAGGANAVQKPNDTVCGKRLTRDRRPRELRDTRVAIVHSHAERGAPDLNSDNNNNSLVELTMRFSFPLLLSVLTLAACEDSKSTTAPTPRDLAPAAVAQTNATTPVAQGKPAQGPALTATIVTSAEAVGAGGMAKSVECPAGTVRTGGGYMVTNEGGWNPPPIITQNYPTPFNGWWVRAIITSPQGGGFKAYAVCVS